MSTPRAIDIGKRSGCPQPKKCTGLSGGSEALEASRISNSSLYLCCSIRGTIPPIGWMAKPFPSTSTEPMRRDDSSLRSA